MRKAARYSGMCRGLRQVRSTQELAFAHTMTGGQSRMCLQIDGGGPNRNAPRQPLISSDVSHPSAARSKHPPLSPFCSASCDCILLPATLQRIYFDHPDLCCHL